MVFLILLQTFYVVFQCFVANVQKHGLHVLNTHPAALLNSLVGSHSVFHFIGSHSVFIHSLDFLST